MVIYFNVMSCTFCQVVKKQKPAKIFFEDDRVIVFADILPRASIHLLVCPKEHFSRLVEIPNDLLLKLMDTVKDIAKELSVEDNFRLVLNNGTQAGQIIEHLHFHFLSNAHGIEVEYKD